MLKRFSEREGYKPAKDKIQIESIDDDLRNSLWNLLYKYYFGVFKSTIPILEQFNLKILDEKVKKIFTFIWLNYFKKPLDEMDGALWDTYGKIKKHFFKNEWSEVYDFIEFIANNNLEYYNLKPISRLEPRIKMQSINEKFIEESNEILERELSAYRFVEKIIANISSKTEIEEIEEAFKKTSKISSINKHLEQSLNLLSDRKNPDYRNSIKESISAVEALCRTITGDEKATLGQALKIVRNKIGLHPALEKGFSNLYGFTSSESGIRHALTEKSHLDFDDAKYFLVSCSAFINYLISKAVRLDINL